MIKELKVNIILKLPLSSTMISKKENIHSYNILEDDFVSFQTVAHTKTH